MNNAQIDDLKTFLVTNIANQLSGAINEVEARLGARIDQLGDRLDARINQLNDRLDTRIDQLDVKVDNGFESIAAILQDNTDVTDNHEIRITQLERRAT